MASAIFRVLGSTSTVRPLMVEKRILVTPSLHVGAQRMTVAIAPSMA